MSVLPRFLRPLFRSIRGRLTLLVAAVLLPAAILATWLILQAYRNEQQAMERHLVETARGVSALVEASLREREALLRGLVGSPYLQNGDIAAFRRQVEAAIRSDREWVVMSDATHQQLLNTNQPPDARLPMGTPLPEMEAALRGGRTFYSNFTIGPASGRPVLYVAIPVPPAENGLGRGLALVMTPEALARTWLSRGAAREWLFALIDREGTIAARSREAARFVGTKASDRMRTAVQARPEGLLESVTLDGVASLTAFHRVPAADWTVVVAAPKAELLGAAQRLLWVALAVALLSGLGAAIIAAKVGHAVVVGVQGLVAATRALGRGDVQEARNTGIDETDIVARALAEASQELAARGAELARARDEALAASRAKDEFMAALSHELRTPLNPVLLLASDAARDPAQAPAARALFASIAKNVALEARLIDDLLDLTRIARGKLRLEKAPVDLHAVLRDAVETVQAELSEKRLTLQLALAAGVAPTLGDAARLQQVFWNVLNNAIKFTPVNGAIQISSRKEDGRVCIEITDTGMGITAVELERIFASFSQGEHAAGGSHRFGGLGLGLAISRQLVELHAGTIRAESKGRGRGSTFVIELPLESESLLVTDQQAPLGREAAVPSGGRRVLLIEDHEPTRTALASLLSKRGYEMTQADTVAGAMRLAEEQSFDLVISDIGLPDGDGYRLMSHLREQYGLAGIALTGYGSEDDVERGRAAGFVAHLTKPVSVQALMAALAGIAPIAAPAS